MCCFWGHLLEANCRSLLRFLDLGMEETSEPTLFRVYFKKSFFLLLIYVDDLIVVGPLSSCAALYGKLAGRYQIKETGRLPPGQVGSCFWEEWFAELSMEEAWSYVSNHPILTTLRRALGESLKVINPPPNLVRFEQQGQEISTSFWTSGLGFPSLCLSCLSIYRGWQVISRVPLWVVNMVFGAQTLGFLWWEARFKCLTYFVAEMEVYKVGPFKWPNQWVAGVITLLTGAMAPFVTGRGPLCNCWRKKAVFLIGSVKLPMYTHQALHWGGSHHLNLSSTHIRNKTFPVVLFTACLGSLILGSPNHPNCGFTLVVWEFLLLSMKVRSKIVWDISALAVCFHCTVVRQWVPPYQN